tara:strand:+ start:3742 stop:5430 length:1689 start_codon:yes stop_codon:yes gene_type:complete
MISFKKLRRGVKLLVEHIYTPISTILAKLTGTGITQNLLAKGSGSFRFNIYFPVITTRSQSQELVGHIVNEAHSASVPFLIPPLQEFTDGALGLNTQTRPQIVLDEVSLSSDDRCESYPLYDWFKGADPTIGANVESQEGSFNVAAPGSQGYTLVIYSKDLTGATGTATPYQDIVYQMEIDAAALNQTVLRLNPYVQSGINVVLDTNKSYLAQIRLTVGTSGSNPDSGLFSVMASLKCRHRLIQRDRGALIQNIPHHNGTFAPTAIAIGAPAANDPIRSSGITGVNTVLEKLDGVVQGKLKGGYNHLSELHVGENFLEDATYEVIAVNLFNGFWCVQGGTGIPVADFDILASDGLPYIAGSSNLPTMDRRIIPLHYPMTVHHVFAAVNYGISSSAIAPRISTKPVSTTLETQIGVGLLAGVRSDAFNYEQIAYRAFDPTDLTGAANTFRIDGAAESSGGYGYNWDIVNIPVVGSGGEVFKNGAAQGRPAFGGRTNSNLAPRRDINGKQPPDTLGKEQAIEVRWAFKDTGANGMNDSARYPDNNTLVGSGGHWVFIYGKKHLI